MPPRPDRLHELLCALDCFSEDDVVLLTSTAATTVEAWRKRGTGPAYILAGNRYLYPRKAVADWLQTKLRERGNAGGASLL